MHSHQNEKVNILVVDDSTDNLRLLSAMLTTQGYEVRKALTGKMALKACKSLQPNLILLDINMPEMNGYELCQQLKADKKISEVPVIFISALDDVLDKVKAFDVGGADYITKPFHAAEVISRIENQINLRSLQVKLHQKNALLQNTLEELKAAQVQQIQNEKMFSLGHLVAGIAHEVNNPVSFIYGNLEYVSEYVRDLINLVEAYQQEYPHPNQNIQKIQQKIDLDFLMKDLESLMGAMYRGADRIRSIVLSLQNFSRHDETSHKQVNIHHGLDSTIVMLHHRLGKTNYRNAAIKIVKEYSDLPLIYSYPSELNQVFMHLLSNAIDSLDEQAKNHQAENKSLQDLTFTPTIWISTCGIESDKPSKSGGLCVKPSAYDVVRISIADNGTGIPDKVREYIFDPFFTTKPVGKGSGLGLSICYQIIVQKHCGKIICNSTLEQGAEFTIEIPIKQLPSN